MSGLLGMFGIGGGPGGTSVDMKNGTNAAQLAQSQYQNQNALQNQQTVLQMLQAQNGVANQSQVYNQLQGVANGTGPNPAQAQLAQATGANVANQAALMAGQRGAGANVGLMARQAAMQGAGAQQQAAGQAATLQANQSLNALGQAGNMANTQAGNMINQANANASSLQNEQNILQGANSQYNAAQSGMAAEQAKSQGKGIGGVLSHIPIVGGLFGAEGGEVPGPQSLLGQQLAQFALGGSVGSQLKAGGSVPGQAQVAGNSYKNDTVQALLSPGEVVIPRNVMQSKDPARGAAEFVQAVLAKKRHGK